MSIRMKFEHGDDGKDAMESLLDKMKSHVENLHGKFKKCHSWCAGRQWFGREGWRWTAVKWLCYLGIGVLSVPSVALILVCLGVLLVGLAGGLAAALCLVVGLLSLAVLVLPLYVMEYLIDFGIISLSCLVLGKDFSDKGGFSCCEPSGEPSSEPSSSSGGTVELVVPRLDEPSSSPVDEPSSSEPSSSGEPSSSEESSSSSEG